MVPLITCLVSVLPAHLVRLLFCARLHVIACIGWPRMLSQQVSATSPFWLQHHDDFLRNPRFTKCAAPGTEMRDDESSIHSVLQDFWWFAGFSATVGALVLYETCQGRYFEAERLIRHGVTLAAVQFVHDQSLEVTGEILSVKSSFFRLNHFEPVSWKTILSEICTSFTVVATRIAEQMLCIQHCIITVFHIWVCLKIGYIPNYSHLIGIMIINHWV